MFLTRDIRIKSRDFICLIFYRDQLLKKRNYLFACLVLFFFSVRIIEQNYRFFLLFSIQIYTRSRFSTSIRVRLRERETDFMNFKVTKSIFVLRWMNDQERKSSKTSVVCIYLHSRIFTTLSLSLATHKKYKIVGIFKGFTQPVNRSF